MERNTNGLFDAPVPGLKPAPLILTSEDIERQLDGEAFLLDTEEAVKMGFLNPYDNDTTSVSIRSAS